MRALQQEGVRATIEVQQSAKKVVHENRRLRALLRRVGVDNDTIDSSVAEQGEEGGDAPDVWRQRERSTKGVGGTGIPADLAVGDSRLERCNTMGAVTGSAPLLKPERINLALPAPTEHRECDPPDVNEFLQAASEPSTSAGTRPPVDVAPSSDASQGPRESEGQHRCRRRSLSGTSVPEISSKSHLSAPCKLLTRLAADPGADITHIPTESDEEALDPAEAPGGIFCSSAYRILMHHATTESKLDAVANVLEEGCVPSATPGQGCMVKNKTIWKALDDICL